MVMNGDWPVAAAVTAIAFALALYYTATAWFKHRERMAMIEQGIDPDRPLTTRPLSDRVKDLARDPAKKIQAIKVYREETGAGLAEAKQAVEAFVNNGYDKPNENITADRPRH
jgi:ribosomal protein L7/L12